MFAFSFIRAQMTPVEYKNREGTEAEEGCALALADRASSLDSGARSERAVFSGGGISSGRRELARWPFFSGGGSERADFSEQNHTQNRKIFPACGPQVGPQAKF